MSHILFWFLIDYIFQISTNRTFTFVDDHTVISTYDFISKFGVFDYLKEVIYDKERFRPMMGINRTFYVLLFGKNLQLISYYFLFLAGITGFFLHKFAYLVGFRFGKSLLFTALVLFGMQGVVWWIFDSSENIAMFFMSVALWAGYQAFINKKMQWLLIPIFGLVTLLMSFSKESFIFILPFFAILFRKNTTVVLYLLLVCFIELLYIKFFIGTTFGYAGVDTTTYSLQNMGKVVAQYMIRGYGIPLFLVMSFLSYQHKMQWKSFWLEQKFYLLIIVVGVIPFLFLYAKSGINVGRYLLPLLVPQVYVLLYLISLVSRAQIRLGIGLIMLFFFVYHGVKFTQLQHDFVTENKSVEHFRDKISLLTSPTDNILLLANPVEDFEKAGALMIYLNSENSLNRKNTKLEIIDLAEYNKTLPVYGEFKFKNGQGLNTKSPMTYPKWLVINDKVLNELTSKGQLQAPHTLISQGNYSIIVFN